MRFFGVLIGAATLLLAASSGTVRAEVDLWPLLEISEETTTVVFPFYVRDRQTAQIARIREERVEVELGEGDAALAREVIRPGGAFGGLSYDQLVARGPGPLEVPDFLMLFPWYYRTDYGRDHHVLWPLLKVSDGRVARVAPLWFGSETRFTLLPLIHRTPEHTIWSIPPAYWRRDGSFQGVFPLYAKFEHELVTFPWYYRSREPDARVDSLVPLFHYRRDASSSRFSSLLYGRWRSPSRSATWAAPLYLRTSTPEVSRTWYFPLWLSTERTHPGYSSSWSSLVWPLYEAKEVRASDGSLSERRHSVLLFLVGRATRPTGSVAWAAPLFYYQRSGEPQRPAQSSLLLLPLYLDQRSRDVSRTWLFPIWMSTQKTTPSDESLSWYAILWPLYARQESRSADGSLLERNRRFLFFSDTLDRDGHRTFKVLGFPVLERM